MPDPNDFVIPPDDPSDKEEIDELKKQKNEEIKKKLEELQKKFKKPEPVKEVVKEVVKEESERAKILREHNNMESNIPINHRYWKLPRG